jgi:hypothetical protein
MNMSASTPFQTRKRPVLILGAILVLSVVLRVGVALYLGDVANSPPLLTDQGSYHTLAVRVLSGNGFSFEKAWYPFTPAGIPTAHWSFLHTLYLAAVYGALGVHPVGARLVSAVAGGLLLPWMVYRLSRRLFPSSQPVAIVSAACAAVYAYFVLYAATLMTETFYVIAVLWSLERAMALVEGPSLGRALVLGLALGLATLLRQSILPWVLVLFLWLPWAGGRLGRLRGMGASLVATALVIACFVLPFTIRNYQVYGDLLLLNSNAGYAMYSAQHPMHGTSFQEFDAARLPSELEGLNEAQMDRELMRRGVGFVLAEPGRYVLLSLSRVRDYFEFWPTADTTLLHNLGRTGSFGLFLPFMVAGIVLALQRADLHCTWASWARFSTSPLALVLLFVAFYSLMHILTWAMPRYRLPVDAVLLVFAGFALVELGRRVGQRIARRRMDAVQ